MKQVLQNLKNGHTEVAEVPCPRAGRGQLLIRTTHTLVSAGTERMLVDFGKGSFIDKPRQQPDKVRTDGLMPTLEAVRNKLDRWTSRCPWVTAMWALWPTRARRWPAFRWATRASLCATALMATTASALALFFWYQRLIAAS